MIVAASSDSSSSTAIRQHFGPCQGKLKKKMISMKFAVDVFGPQRMNPDVFDEPLVPTTL